MRIFITGGTGFIGKHLVSLLKSKNQELLLLSRAKNNAPYIKGDLSNIKYWKNKLIKFKPEAAIHLAWENTPHGSASQHSSLNSADNLIYGLNLIKALNEAGCKKILMTGSCWEYGKSFGKLKETDPVNYSNSFVIAKNCLHFLGRKIAEENNMRFIWTRFFFVYGPGQRRQSIIPYLLDCFNKNLKPDIKNPFNKNDFVYVEDVAEAIWEILKNNNSGPIYNIGTGCSVSIEKVASIVYGIKKKELLNKSSQNQPTCDFYANIIKIKKEIGWKPKTDIETGIKKFIKNRNRI